MAQEFITKTGRIFKQDINGISERKGGEYGGKMNKREFVNTLARDYETPKDLTRLKDAGQQFSQLMWDKANNR